MNFGIVCGILWLLAKLGGTGGIRPHWVYKWFRGVKGFEAKFIDRAKSELSSTLNFNDLRLFWPLVPIVLVTLFFATIAGEKVVDDFMKGLLIGYAGSAALGVILGVLKRPRLQVAIYAAQKVAQQLSPSQAEKILIPLSKSSLNRLRQAAVAGLRELGTPLSRQTLQDMIDDPVKETSKAGQEAFDAVSDLLIGKIARPPIHVIDRLCADHAGLLPKIGHKIRSKEHKINLQRFEETVQKMDQFVFAHLPMRHAFPHVYCRDCLAWAERIEYESYEWIRCHACKQAGGLVMGVKYVVGELGGTNEWLLEDGILRLNLWDETQRKVRLPDMNEIEIIADNPINYDWAVSAVLDKLHNIGLPLGKRPVIKLVAGVTLEPNTLRLLEVYEGAMQLTGSEAR